MSEEKTQGCSGNCGSCSSNCASREKQSLIEPTGEFNNIKHVIGVVSGKGGVGKSMVTSMLAVLMQRKGYKVGILDADITDIISIPVFVTAGKIPISFCIALELIPKVLGIEGPVISASRIPTL